MQEQEGEDDLAASGYGARGMPGSLDVVTPKAIHPPTTTSNGYFGVQSQPAAARTAQPQEPPSQPTTLHHRQPQPQPQPQSQSQTHMPKQDPSPSKNSLKPLSLSTMHLHAPHLPTRSHSSQSLQAARPAGGGFHAPLLARRQASAAAGFPASASQPSLQSLHHVPHSFTASPHHNHHHSPAWQQQQPASGKYSLANMSLAMDKMEGRSTEVKPGENGAAVGALGFGGGDEWQTICVRVLPLFNGETAKGYIEELNDLVTAHARRIIDLSPNRALTYLNQHFTQLADMGMLTLADKLHSASGYNLLARLNELWVLFWGAVRPYLLAVFLPYATDTILVAAASKIGQAPHIPPVDVERLLCRSFRDQVIAPLARRLEPMFVREAFETGTASRRSSLGFNEASRTSSGLSLAKNRLSESNRTATGRHRDSATPAPAPAPTNDERNVGRALRMQMISVLAMLRTGDAGQERADILAAALRGFGSTKLTTPDERAWYTKRSSCMYDGGEEKGAEPDEDGPHVPPIQASARHTQRPARTHWSWTPGQSDDEEDDSEEESEDGGNGGHHHQQRQLWMRRPATRQASWASTGASSSARASGADSGDEGW